MACGILRGRGGFWGACPLWGLQPPAEPGARARAVPVVREISSNAEWLCNKFFKLAAATV